MPDDSDEYIWTSDTFRSRSSSAVPELNRRIFEMEKSSLRCPICGDLFRNAVSLKACYHSFCSECIRLTLKNGRNSMKRKRECPVCRENIREEDDKAIIPNRGLQEVVRSYDSLREILWQRLVLFSASERKGTDECVPEKINRADLTYDPPVLRKRQDKDDMVEQNNFTTLDEGNGEGNIHKRARHNLNMGAEEVNCNLNTHKTNHCVSTSLKQSSPRKHQFGELPDRTRKPKAATHYHGMKKRRLQDLCRNEGLSTKGTDVELRSRHQEYIYLWNAECDAIEPRNTKELIAEVQKRESARDKELKQSICNGSGSHEIHMKNLKENMKVVDDNDPDTIQRSNLSVPKSNSTIIVSSGNYSFDQKLDSGFKALIEAAKSKGIAKNRHIAVDQKEKNVDQRKYTHELSTCNHQRLCEKVGYHSFGDSSTIEEVRVKVLSDSSTKSMDSNQTSRSTKPVKKEGFKSEDIRKSKIGTKPDNKVKGSWVCLMCTFLNETRTWSAASCEMCGTLRNVQTKGYENV
mmetsp:Transcript_2647/g.3738  ORF Transcript_2647/g.3738 Transcript_2647/m.3738 type:complete len:519 (+) Transcript_2647:3-1559(+)